MTKPDKYDEALGVVRGFDFEDSIQDMAGDVAAFGRKCAADARELEEMLGDSLVRADRAENKAVGMAIKIRYALQDAEWQYERALDTKNTNDLSHWGGRIAQYEEFFKGLRDEERKADVARATLAALAAATPPQQER